MLLPITPQILHRIKFRSIGRQGLKIDPAILLCHKVLNQPATMNRSTVPDDKKIAVDVAHQMRKEFNHLGTSDTARIEPKVKIPPRDSRHCRERLPIKRILKHRRLSSWRPGPATVRTLAQSALVDKYYRTALPLGFFLSRGQRFFFHCAIETSSRSSARAAGRWQLHPIFPNNHQIWRGWYLTPHSSLISAAIRASVQSPVSYPSACGPCLSSRSILLRSDSLSRDLRPARPAFFSPARPCSAICLRHRPTDWRCTPSSRATCASVNPRLNNVWARSRRSSNASKSLSTPAGFPMQGYLSQTPSKVTIFYDSQ